MQAHILPTIAELPALDRRALYGDRVEGPEFFAACESAPPPDFRLSAVVVRDGDRHVMAAPLFETAFRVDLAVEGTARRIGSWIGERAPRLIKVPILGIGSPHADSSGIGVRTDLDVSARTRAMAALLSGLAARARQTGARIMCAKSLADAECDALGPALVAHRYVRVPILPVARLALPDSEEAYFASLSQNMRSNMRRRLKRAAQVRTEIRATAAGLEDQLNALREGTRRRATADYDVFEGVGPGLNQAVLERLGERARLLLYWLDDALIGFAIVLIEPGAIIEKYNGMRYPEGPDNGVFYLNWMTQVRLGIAHGCRELRAGETTYLIKARLGCNLHRSWVYVRSRGRLLNSMLHLARPLIRLDGADPGLKELGAAAPYAHLQQPGAAVGAEPASRAPQRD